MPILNFEYSSNLNLDQKIKTFLLETHLILVDVIKTDLLTCRSSIDKRENYVIGDDNKKSAFIVLRIQMLPGRSDEQKDHLGNLLVKKIKDDFHEIIRKYDTQVRVYLTDTDMRYYYGLAH